jgi:hypothetical protein
MDEWTVLIGEEKLGGERQVRIAYPAHGFWTHAYRLAIGEQFIGH